MADYDSKIIPVLDDIIDPDFSETTASRQSPGVTLNDEDRLETDSPDLFSMIADDFCEQHWRPETTVIEDMAASALPAEITYETEIRTDTRDNDDNSDEAENTSSALIDYHHDMAATYTVFSHSPERVDNDTAAGDEDEPAAQNQQQTETAETTTATTDTLLTLESIAADIVKQLMPDLEQQLRFVVQQALEDRLDDDVLARLSTKNNPQ